jgi:XTP/dITP diphosphohydrolase
VFFVPEAELTFAEMPHSQKAALGHRGRAFAALKPRLEALLAEAHGSDGL